MNNMVCFTPSVRCTIRRTGPRGGYRYCWGLRGAPAQNVENASIYLNAPPIIVAADNLAVTEPGASTCCLF